MTTDAASPATTVLKPLREGMFKVPPRLEDPAHLIGTRCRACGEGFFPRRRYCAACTSADMEDVEFADTGEVETFTVVRQQPPNAAVQPPYAIVRVQLDDGPSVQTIMTGDDLPAAKIGGRVRLAVRRLMDDNDGNTVVSFMARPDAT